MGDDLSRSPVLDFFPIHFLIIAHQFLKMHSKFKLTDSITYLDAETSVFSKEVDGILFVGSCFYTNMALKHDYFNPTGDVNKNCKFS